MKLVEEGNSYKKVEKMTGLSKSTFIRAMRLIRAKNDNSAKGMIPKGEFAYIKRKISM